MNLEIILPFLSVIITTALGAWVTWGKTQRDAAMAELTARLDALIAENDTLRTRITALENELTKKEAQINKITADLIEELRKSRSTRRQF